MWKGYYRDVLLFALKDLSAMGMADGDVQSLGRFHPHRIAHYYALMTRSDLAGGNLERLWHLDPTYIAESGVEARGI